MIKTIDIRPDANILGLLRNLNYRPWYALGEFVDNSLESFSRHHQELKEAEDDNVKLRVKIDIDATSPASINIRDNAAGICESEYNRSFRPAAIPPDRTGLAEFGMGMKSAACWFSPKWSVRTSALGEPIVRLVQFDIHNIVNDDITELTIVENETDAIDHYTEIILQDIFSTPVGRTIGKIKDHLADIYREFIRRDTLELYFNGDKLEYEDPNVLVATHYRNQDGPIKPWRKSIEFDFGEGLSVHGFAAIREKASTAKAGFSLFRRGRVIQGSGDEGYRPSQIFGSSNRYRYQRLFGELHLEGFEVSHTKDGFLWDDNEQPFLELLHEHLDREPMPLLKQAEGHRVRAEPGQLENSARNAITNTTRVMEESLPDILPDIADSELVDTPTEETPSSPILAGRQFDIQFRDIRWSINVELTNDPAESQWLTVSNRPKISCEPRRLGIRVSMRHPFMVRFVKPDSEDIEAILRIAAALAIAEVLASDSGVRNAGTIRRNVNEIIQNALSRA